MWISPVGILYHQVFFNSIQMVQPFNRATLWEHPILGSWCCFRRGARWQARFQDWPTARSSRQAWPHSDSECTVFPDPFVDQCVVWWDRIDSGAQGPAVYSRCRMATSRSEGGGHLQDQAPEVHHYHQASVWRHELSWVEGSTVGIDLKDRHELDRCVGEVGNGSYGRSWQSFQRRPSSFGGVHHAQQAPGRRVDQDGGVVHKCGSCTTRSPHGSRSVLRGRRDQKELRSWTSWSQTIILWNRTRSISSAWTDAPGKSGQTFVTLTRSSATWSFTCFDLFCVTCNVAVPLNVGPCWTYLLETCDLPLCLQCWRFVSTFGECSSQEFNLLDYVFCLPEKNLPYYALLTSPLICGIT